MNMSQRFWAEKRGKSFSKSDDASQSGNVYRYVYYSIPEFGRPVICLAFTEGNRKSLRNQGAIA